MGVCAFLFIIRFLNLFQATSDSFDLWKPIVSYGDDTYIGSGYNFGFFSNNSKGALYFCFELFKEIGSFSLDAYFMGVFSLEYYR